MRWEAVDPELRAKIEQRCTAKQVDALRLRAHGYGARRIARILGISPAAVKDRVQAAELRLTKPEAPPPPPKPPASEARRSRTVIKPEHARPAGSAKPRPKPTPEVKAKRARAPAPARRAEASEVGVNPFA